MDRLIRTENIIDESLIPCPFCGATSKEFSPKGSHRFRIVILKKCIEEPDSFGIPEPIRTRFYVKCTNCGAMGGSGVAGFNSLTNHTITEPEAKEIAIQKWNGRI